jgi:hypothetical protein
MQIQMVTFSEPKEGNTPGEWQDGAGGGVVGDGTATPRRARFVVLDGATGAYDPVRWVDQLVRSFVPQAGGDPRTSSARGSPGSQGPRLEPAAMRAWFAEMQDRWAADVRDFDSIIEERKFAEVGSFATFPPMGPDDFGTLPDGVHTSRASLDRMTERLLTGGGVLEAGDFLFAATDAMAQWILRTIEREEAKVWDALTTLAHPDVFARLVEDQRREQNSAKRMKNDDVTLMRLRMLAGQPAFLLACR